MITSYLKRQYYCEFVGNTEAGERYRVGIQDPKFFILKPKSIRDQNQDGILATHDIYREYPNTLFRIPDEKVFEKLNKNLSKARQAMRNQRRNQILAETGFYQSSDYKKWQKQNRYGH